MSLIAQVRRFFFPHVPASRRKRERNQLLMGIVLGLLAALVAGGMIYALQDRLAH